MLAHNWRSFDSLREQTLFPIRSNGIVAMLCRLTAHGPFMPSSRSNTTSETTPRIVDVMGATVTVPKCPRMLARVNSTTGRFLSGAANWQRCTSPRLSPPAMPACPPTSRSRLCSAASLDKPLSLSPQAPGYEPASHVRQAKIESMRSGCSWTSLQLDQSLEAAFHRSLLESYA